MEFTNDNIALRESTSKLKLGSPALEFGLQVLGVMFPMSVILLTFCSIQGSTEALRGSTSKEM